jgi:DNA-binding CsgD family transcriptional regulator
LLYKEISDRLGISYSTVHKYQHQLFGKLHVSNRSEAIRVWLESGGG